MPARAHALAMSAAASLSLGCCTTHPGISTRSCEPRAKSPSASFSPPAASSSGTMRAASRALVRHPRTSPVAQSKAASWLLAKYSRALRSSGKSSRLVEVEHPEQVSKCGHPSEKASSVDASARVSATSEVTTVAARRTGDSARFRALALDAFLDALACRGDRVSRLPDRHQTRPPTANIGAVGSVLSKPRAKE